MKLALKTIIIIAVILGIMIGIRKYNIIDYSKGEGFRLKIEKLFSDGRTIIPLKEATDFKWDKVCIFLLGDSAPYSAYSSYRTYLEENDVQIEPLPEKNYHTIFVFHDGMTIRQFPSTRYISISGKEYGFARSEVNKKNGKCLDSNVEMERKDPWSIIFQAEGERG